MYINNFYYKFGFYNLIQTDVVYIAYLHFLHLYQNYLQNLDAGKNLYKIYSDKLIRVLW